MGTYYTDFSEYVLGSAPSDWTIFWHTSGISLDIAAGDIGSKLLYADTTTQDRFAWAWDDISAVADVDILCKVKSVTGDDFLIGPACCLSGGSTTETGYRLSTDITNNEIVLRRFSSGSGSGDLDTYAFTQVVDTYYWLRMNVSSGVIKGKIWTDGDTEPGTWQIDYTDGSPLSAGAVGLATYSRDGYCDYFSVGTAGDSAPSPITTVDTPVILPTSGEYDVDQLISMTCATAGASIYYTIDGSTPDSGDTLYSTSFALVEAKTVKAIGIKAGDTDSDVVSESYTITEVIVPGKVWGIEVGDGPWDFTEQPNKWGYLNNPRWTESPEPGHQHNYNGREDEEPQVWNINGNYSSGESGHHLPCGHWHKGRTITEDVDVNIYGLFISIGNIYGAHFDGEHLTYTGDYKSTPDLNGLIIYNGDLLTISDSGADAVLDYISSTPVAGSFPLISQEDIFNDYDIETAQGARLAQGRTDTEIFAVSSAGRTIRTDSLVRQERGFYGGVTTGGDGNLYRLTQLSLVGNPTWGGVQPPLTTYGTYWTLIQDNINDGTTVSWGVGTVPSCAKSAQDQVSVGNNLFVIKYFSPSSFISRITLPDYEEAQYVNSSNCHDIVAFKGYIFGICGIFGAQVRRFDQSDLTQQIVTGYIGGQEVGDIVATSTHIIVGTSVLNKYTVDLTLVASIDLPLSCQELVLINDTFVAVGSNNHLSIYNLNTMTIVDQIEIGTDIGWSHRELVVKEL